MNGGLSDRARVFGDYENRVTRVPFLQLHCDVVDEEFVAGNGQAVLGIKVCEAFLDYLWMDRRGSYQPELSKQAAGRLVRSAEN